LILPKSHDKVSFLIPTKITYMSNIGVSYSDLPYPVLHSLLSALLFSYHMSDGDLFVTGNTHTDLPTASPAPSPVPSPVPSALPSTAAPSSTSLSVTAIQNEGLACMAMAASLPGLQTLTGECVWWSITSMIVCCVSPLL
jgi:hypothetical protein